MVFFVGTMTNQQVEILALFGAIVGFLLWGRFRHDLVAASGLFVAVLLGIVPEARAFSGFSHPAVLIVALVLVASRAFENSGALNVITSRLINKERSLTTHIAVTGGVGAVLSAVINNVAALALLIPVDVEAARKAGRSPSLTLMPLSFATILGGMMTMIGTPPNIIASAFRARELGAPYQMFDFTPVGLAVATAGLAFVALVGWRLIPKTGRDAAPPARAEEFIADLKVTGGSPAVGKFLGEIEHEAETADVMIIRLVRDGQRLRGEGRFDPIQPGDVLAVEGSTDGLAAFIKALALHETGKGDDSSSEAKEARKDTESAADQGKDAARPAMIEAVVRANARIAGQSAVSLRLRERLGITLLGVAHQGKTFRQEVRARVIEPGDVLLLTGPRATLHDTIKWLGAMPINEVSVSPVETWRVALTVGLFSAAVIAASTGFLSFTTAIAIAVAGYAAAGLVPPREFYSQIDWPVVVMLACLLPLGEAVDRLGGTALVAGLMLDLARGQSAVVVLVLLMIMTMTLSDVLNNAATMVIAGPLALAMAHKLGVNPDTFLMGVTVASSCAFLTPIGHQNNTLIMGPGGYAFTDYWRLGLALEAVVLAAGVPMLLLVWPL